MRIRQAQEVKTASAFDPTAPRLEDLAGYGRAAEWGMRLRDDLAAFRSGKESWRNLDAQAILHGSPGTGKSLFARSLARSLKLPLVVTSVSDWFSTHAGDLGSTIKAAAAAFEQARGCYRRTRQPSHAGGVERRPRVVVATGGELRPGDARRGRHEPRRRGAHRCDQRNRRDRPCAAAPRAIRDPARHRPARSGRLGVSGPPSPRGLRWQDRQEQADRAAAPLGRSDSGECRRMGHGCPRSSPRPGARRNPR